MISLAVSMFILIQAIGIFLMTLANIALGFFELLVKDSQFTMVRPCFVKGKPLYEIESKFSS